MLGNRNRMKRRRKLEDDLPVQESSPSLEWQRCMEGFSDFDDNFSTTSKTKKLRTHKPSCQSFLESSFDQVPDHGSDPSGLSDVTDAELISWSSSDSEGEGAKVDSSKEHQFRQRKGTIKSENVSKAENSSSKKTPRVAKANKLELRRLSPSFDHLARTESDEEIGDIGSSPDSELGDRSGNSKPHTHIADLPKQVSSQTDKMLEVSPVKTSRICTHARGVDSPSIGSIQSGVSSTSESPGTSGMKVSDWVKAIDWQTPVKADNQDDGELEAGPDSAKKKRIKYKKGGLASQLSRLQSRERTAVRIWEHENADELGGLEDTSSKACLVRVLCFEVLYSLQLAHCKVANINQSEEGGEGNSMDSEESEWKSQIILFSKHMMEKLQIEAGALVKIYPPWQQLQLASLDNPVLLCTNYCRVVSPASQPPINDTPYQREVFAQWSCPCTRDTSMSLEDCEVNQMPFHPSSSCLDSQVSISPAANKSSIPPSALETVTVSQFPVMPVCRSLLEAIQRTNLGRSLNFTAVIQRVFCTSASRHSFLIEDSHGTMAVIHMGDNPVEDQVSKAEGKTCSFSGLRVVTRSNKERHQVLFSVMERAWSGHMAALSSQESQEDEPASSTSCPVTCPGFCYILAPAENAQFSVSISFEQSSLYRPPQLSPLAQAQQAQPEKRVSFLARVIYRSISKEADNAGKSCSVWYVTDESLPSSYTTLSLASDCFAPRLKSFVAVFTDVHVVDGKFHADGYTRIRNEVPPHIDDELVMERYQNLVRLQVSLPLVSITVQPGSLVTVQDKHLKGNLSYIFITRPTVQPKEIKLSGVITSIDEEAAYSWEECDRCGSDRLVEDNMGPSTCASCKRRVTSPVTKMKMEVYIQCAELEKGIKVKVDLLQSSVEKLLPRETDNEEGYDIDSVLYKEVGPHLGVVKSISREDGHTKIYVQEVS